MSRKKTTNPRIVLPAVLWFAWMVLPATLHAQATTDKPGDTKQLNAAKLIVPGTGDDAVELQSTSNAPSSQSTGESSKRIFGVVPTYNITDVQNAPPLTPRQKFELFAKGTLDPFPFAAYALQAGVSQASDSHSGYGQGLAGYGKRFGAACLDGTSARFFGTYAFPALFHQDPRYFRKGQGSAWSRVRYSITRGFVTRSDSGNSQPNWSNVFGKFTAAGLSNLYYPAADRGADLTLTRVAISLSYQTLGNLAIEFWPEIHRKLSGGKKSS
jgi:hypothetical protein